MLPLRFIKIRSLGFKFSLAIIAIIFLVVFLISSFFLGQERRALESELQKMGIHIVEDLSHLSTDHVLQEDWWRLYEHIKVSVYGKHTNVESRIVNYAMIIGKDGKLLAHSHPEDFKIGEYVEKTKVNDESLKTNELLIQPITSDSGESLYDITAPIFLDDHKIGLVRIGITRKYLEQTIKAVRNDIMVIGIGLILAGILFGILASKKITGPLVELSQQAEKIGNGNFDVRIKLGNGSKCWEIEECNQTECPAYKNEGTMCWYTVGTMCDGEVQGHIAKKILDCKKCEVYKLYHTDEILQLATSFNQMTAALGQRDQEIQENHEELQASYSQLQSATAELEMSKLNLEQVNKDLIKANTAKSNFLSMVSHELRTPLTVIRGYLSLILEGEISGKPEELMEILGVLNKRSQHLQRLIEDLLDISRIESGKLKLRKEVVDPVKHLKESIKMLDTEIEKKNLKIRFEIPEGFPVVYTDHDKLHQIFTNLIDNAIKFSKDEGEIVFEARDLEPIIDEKFLEFSISDTGIGIPAEEIDKIFDRFYQIDATDTRKYGGSGLGLAIVKEVINLHNGTIRVESTWGKGSKFIFTLPKTDKALKEEYPLEGEIGAELVNEEVADVVEEGEMKTILIVDDDEELAKMIEFILPKEKYNLLVAYDGEAGLEKVSAEKIDLILLDIMMPKLDGYEVCKILKNSDNTKHIPIIMLTAAGQENQINDGYNAGADDYMIKPFEPSELRERLQKNLKNKSKS